MPKKWTKVELEAQAHTLRYLIDIACKTEGAEVWRALFAEVYETIQRDIEALKK